MEQSRPFGRLSARDRIRKRSEFRSIQDAGHRVVSPAFVFLLGRSCERAGIGRRLGVTASRRVGNAPQRNRAKRLLREAFRRVREDLPAGLDVVVIVRHALGNATLADVVSEWRSCRARIERRFASVPAPAECADPAVCSRLANEPEQGAQGPALALENLPVKNSC